MINNVVEVDVSKWSHDVITLSHKKLMKVHFENSLFSTIEWDTCIDMFVLVVRNDERELLIDLIAKEFDRVNSDIGQSEAVKTI